MSSSKIIRDNDPRDCSIEPYCIQEMQHKKGPRDAQTDSTLNEAGVERESIEMEAYRKGLEQGQAQGQKMASKRIEPIIKVLGNAVEELRKMRHIIIEKHQDQILEILCLIAEKIIHREIQLSPEIIMDTVRQACTYLNETDEIRLRIHPSDFEYIRDIEEILSTHRTGKSTLHFVEDSTLDKGGVVIDTEFGEIDASIRSQIEHMKEVLLEK